ncbi:MAG: sigma-70 family RNA polymerase sigma factor [bacterium]|nr:sigma-70 family RNA polymerase sigma factor [bacterium]
MDQKPSADSEAELVAQLTRSQLAISVYVRSLMPGEQGTDEVVQQTNAKIWQKRAEFQAGTNFRAWACAIARYEVLNFRKQQARDRRLQFSAELEQTLAMEVVELEDDLAERQSALRQCLDQLPAESRELLMLRYGSKETLPNFAARMGRSADGLKVTLHRLRNKLAGCIERRLANQGGI